MISFFTRGAFSLPLAIIFLSSMIHARSPVIRRALQDVADGSEPAMCFKDLGASDDPNSMKYKTYYFYSCMSDLKIVEESACFCGLTRTVTVPSGQMVAIHVGEYLSLSACNSVCGRSKADKCWFCDEEQVFTGDGSIQPVRSCQHVQDVLPSVVPQHLRFASGSCFRRCNNLIEAECVDYTIKLP